MSKTASLLEIFVENATAALDIFEWLKNWKDDLTYLKTSKVDGSDRNLISANVPDLDTLESLLVVLNASYASVAEWHVNGEPQAKDAGSSSSDYGEIQTAISAVVKIFRQDPRNKIFIDAELLLKSACYELQKPIKIGRVRRSIKNYINGKLSSSDQDVYDAAVVVCGEVARQCFAPDSEEVDYELSWLENDKGYVGELRSS